MTDFSDDNEIVTITPETYPLAAIAAASPLTEADMERLCEELFSQPRREIYVMRLEDPNRYRIGDKLLNFPGYPSELIVTAVGPYGCLAVEVES